MVQKKKPKAKKEPKYLLNDAIGLIHGTPQQFETWFNALVEKDIGSEYTSPNGILRIDGSSSTVTDKGLEISHDCILYVRGDPLDRLPVPRTFVISMVEIGEGRSRAWLASTVSTAMEEYIDNLLSKVISDWPGSEFIGKFAHLNPSEDSNNDQESIGKQRGAPRLEDRWDWEVLLEHLDEIKVSRERDSLSIQKACDLSGITRSRYYRVKKRRDQILSQ